MIPDVQGADRLGAAGEHAAAQACQGKTTIALLTISLYSHLYLLDYFVLRVCLCHNLLINVLTIQQSK